MKYRISASNERVWCTTQLAKLSFNRSIVRTHSWRFPTFMKYKTEQKNRADYRLTGTDKKNEIRISITNRKYQSSRRNIRSMTSHEYEYFASARTPVTKSSARDHTASLFCFIQRTTSTYHTSTRVKHLPGARPSGVKIQINTRIIRLVNQPTCCGCC